MTTITMMTVITKAVLSSLRPYVITPWPVPSYHLLILVTMHHNGIGTVGRRGVHMPRLPYIPRQLHTIDQRLKYLTNVK